MPAAPPRTVPAKKPASALAPPGQPAPARVDARWGLAHYVVKERRGTFGNQYRILDPQGNVVAYAKQKMFRLREDIRFYADESKQVELFRLATQQIFDWGANFAIIDSATSQPIAFARRKGLKSLWKDEWRVAAPDGRHLGTMHELGGIRALLRRCGEVIATFIPARYSLLWGAEGQEVEVAQIRERFQFWGDTYDVRRTNETPVDARVMISLVVLADAVGVGSAGT